MKYIYTFLLVLLLGCGSETSQIGPSTISKNEPIQLNITVLLDLSDRIDPNTHPSQPQHFEKDIEIIKYLAKMFTDDMKSKGTFMAKGKLKVIFSPKPADPNINVLAEKLNVDLSKVSVQQKKVIYENIVKDFGQNATNIYKTTINNQKWHGSDIWRFFKNDVKDFCINSDSSYRNILVILTDGYIYHKDSKDKIDNRYAYLLSQNIDQFRNKADWESKFDNLDFGLISKRSDLNNLEVLVLEVNPYEGNANDEDIIRKTLSKWFNEMNVRRFAIYNSDLSSYTKQRIEQFINE